MEKIEKRVGDSSNRFIIILVSIGIICILISGVLSYQYIHRIGHRPRPIPRQTDVLLIQSWMSVPYIARMYHVPEPELAQGLHIDPNAARMQSLSTIAGKQGKQTEEIIALVQQVIVDFQKKHSVPSAFPSR